MNISSFIGMFIFDELISADSLYRKGDYDLTMLRSLKSITGRFTAVYIFADAAAGGRMTVIS
jgi:hypothetical protein